MRVVFDILNGKCDISGDDLNIVEFPDSIVAHLGEYGPRMEFIYWKNTNKLEISQHMFGGPKNVYYCVIDNCLYMYSSLKDAKAEHGMPFELNRAMLPHFLYNGFLPEEHTLIKGIRKIAPGYKFLISKDGVSKKRLSIEELVFGDATYADNRLLSASELAEIYDDVVPDAISSAIFDNGANKPLHIALSGGFDSNSILYNIKKQDPARVVNAYCIGGVNGVDETEVSADIAGLYDNISLKASYVGPYTLEALDEIVDILEGSAYERGIFLQFELAKLLKANNCDKMICGECADQVFHEKTYSLVPEDNFLCTYPDTPLQMASYVVLKKNQLMLSHFGIDVRYPFLDENVITLGYMTRHLNGRTKEFHKAQCRRVFPEKLSSKLGKQGGSTSLSALFDTNVDFTSYCKDSPYNMTDFHLKGAFTWDEAIMDYYLTLRYLESFEKQFCDR